MMNDDWAHYPRQHNERPALVTVNTQLADAMEASARPWLVTFETPLPESDEQGLPSQPEHDTLHAMNHFMAAYAQTNHGLYVGHISTRGLRTHHLYLAEQPSTNQLNLFLEHIQEQTGADTQAQCSHDPQHRAYWEDLLPTAEHWDYLENLNLIQSIIDYGDDLARPRPVTHWVYFDEHDNREQFADWALNHDFNIIGHSQPAPEDGIDMHGIELSHVISPTIEAITDVTQQLKEAAQAFGGQYDGWETSLARTLH